MLFNNELSSLQQKTAGSSAGVRRRLKILKALEVENGQTIIDIGCGGEHLIKELAMSVGPNDKIYGLDPSKAQLASTRKRCPNFDNVEFLCCSAVNSKLPDTCLNSATSTQTLEYIKDVYSALSELTRLLKGG